MAQIAKAKKSVEKKGTGVVMWIIGCLIVRGLLYAAWSIYIVS